MVLFPAWTQMHKKLLALGFFSKLTSLQVSNYCKDSEALASKVEQL